MKKRFTEEQIIGFLREAEARLPINEVWPSRVIGESGEATGLSRNGSSGDGRGAEGLTFPNNAAVWRRERR